MLLDWTKVGTVKIDRSDTILDNIKGRVTEFNTGQDAWSKTRKWSKVTPHF